MKLIFKNRIKNSIAILGIVIVSVFLYALTIHGVAGNPSVLDFKGKLDQRSMPLELSPERGRFVHVYALAENHKYELGNELGRIAYPDVGVYDGKIYSFFAPGISYYATPFYLVGRMFNLSQVFTFASVSIIAIIAMIFIFLISRNIFKLPVSASLFAVLTYGFASTSWSYAVTLYQHHGTALLMLSGVYAVWRFREAGKLSFLYAGYAWLAYGLAIFIDYPNIILVSPVIAYLLISAFSMKRDEGGVTFYIRWSALFAMYGLAIITGVHFYHNMTHYGGWSKLAGGLENYVLPEDRISRIASSTNVIASSINATTSNLLSTESTTTVVSSYTNLPSTLSSDGTKSSSSGDEGEKDIVHFFKESYVPKGSFILLVGSERGLLFFWPTALLSFIGVYVLRKKLTGPMNAMIALVLTNIFLYSSWGDPWGGWAFGPRYLIPSMAFLSIFAAAAVYYGRFPLKRFLAWLLFLYSSAIALLGVLTTNAVPRMDEIKGLAIQKYNYFFNIEVMKLSESSSYVYKQYFSDYLYVFGYFFFIYCFLIILGSVIIWSIPKKSHE